MTAESVGVNIRILDKDYRIACQPEEQEGLMASARLVDSRMREIRHTGRVIGTDRIAVLAALNIAHELIQLQRRQREQGGQTDGADAETLRRLSQLEDRVASVLSGEPHLDASSNSV